MRTNKADKKKRAPDYLAKWQERRKELKQKRINRMKEKELEKLKKGCPTFTK
jgi:ADP-ribosylglycohydrolase